MEPGDGRSPGCSSGLGPGSGEARSGGGALTGGRGSPRRRRENNLVSAKVGDGQEGVWSEIPAENTGGRERLSSSAPRMLWQAAPGAAARGGRPRVAPKMASRGPRPPRPPAHVTRRAPPARPGWRPRVRVLAAVAPPLAGSGPTAGEVGRAGGAGQWGWGCGGE